MTSVVCGQLYARMAVDGYVLQPELMSVLVGVNDTCLDGQRPNGVPLGLPLTCPLRCLISFCTKARWPSSLQPR